MKRYRYMDTGSVIKRQAKRRKTGATTYVPRAAITTEVKKQISKNSDYKSTVVYANIGVSYVGSSVSVLGSLTRGSGMVDQFEGSTINIQGITIRANCIAADTTQTLRMVVVQWADATVPTAN